MFNLFAAPPGPFVSGGATSTPAVSSRTLSPSAVAAAAAAAAAAATVSGEASGQLATAAPSVKSVPAVQASLTSRFP